MTGRVLVTGADGFIGRHLLRILSERGIQHRAAVRRRPSGGDPECVAVGDIGARTDWREALDGVEAVVHLAGRAHVLREKTVDPYGEFMRANAEGTATLAAAAAVAGVRRLVYVSSIGVLGNQTTDVPFRDDSVPQPHNSYAKSKLAGELAARSAADSGLAVVVVRPPLVYGSGVAANFLRLLRWIDRKIPLPLGAVNNRRSLVNVWNLCDLLVTFLDNPAAAGGTWLVSDGEDLSTPELIRRIAAAMGRRVRLPPVPVRLLELCGRLTGRGMQISSLCSSLTVDIGRTQRELGWSPSVPLNEAIARTVAWYLAEGGSRGS
jgi:nucleoside-diphosphate-sugar epimerase